MDEKLRNEMMRYYDERAEEYDDVFAGRVRSATDPAVYRRDAAAIAEMASGFGRGSVLDVGCGTGYWLQFYAPNCERLTLLDQSERMLERSRRRAEAAGVAGAAEFVLGDFEAAELPRSAYDAALVGFVLSHVPSDREDEFMGRLTHLLRPQAQLLVADSAWSDWRRDGRPKDGRQVRTLNDGTEFAIYKRYFDAEEIPALLERFGFAVRASYCGEAWTAVLGERE